MARGDEVRVSLFPFMSVLACTIGALILLLTSLSVSAVAPPSPVDPESPPSSDPSDASAERQAQSDAATLGQTLARVEALFERLDRSLGEKGAPPGASLAELEAEAIAGAPAARTADQVEAGRARLLDRLAADRDRLHEALARIEPDRAKLEAEIAVLESRRATLPILIDPTGISRHLAPWFVECDGDGLTAYRVKDDLRHFVPRAEISPAGDFGRYLRRLRATPGALLVLLVRSDGLSTAASAAYAAEASGVRVAQLPLPGQGALDWSLLREAEGSAGEVRP